MTNHISKTIRMGSHTVPGFWQKILPGEVIHSPVCHDTIVDCHSCIGVHAKGYSPKSRCCTYYPKVPNFLIGLSLMDEVPQHPLHQMIKKGFVIPSGLEPSPGRIIQSHCDYQQKKWGISESSICDFFTPEKGCQIYSYRNGVCSSWFCEAPKEKLTQPWWSKIRDIISHCETVLSRWAMEQAGLDLDLYEKTFFRWASNIDGIYCQESLAWSSKFLDEIWQGHERERFMKTCTEFIILYQEDLLKLVQNLKVPSPSLYQKNLEEWLKKQQDHKNSNQYIEKVQYQTYQGLVQELKDLEDQVTFEREINKLRSEIGSP